jgi:predicted molibdopterin-dependent oxidoreductase YjgC
MSITDPTPVTIGPPPRLVDVTIDGEVRQVAEGATLLDAARDMGTDIPTLCYGDTLTPKNACRVCMVEVEGARVLAPACSRKVEPGMVVHTDSSRVRLARRMVLEFLASSVDMSAANPEVGKWMAEYGAEPIRYGAETATVAQPAKVDNGLYVRDYSRCILCYKCVDACGEQWQQTFAIAVAGRGFDSRISTEWDTPLPDSACVYCGNCVEVCPTGALSFAEEFRLKEAGDWDPSRQTQTDTICPYCGVGCTLRLHVQDNRIVRVTSPHDQFVTRGNLCIKGRFGFSHVQP